MKKLYKRSIIFLRIVIKKLVVGCILTTVSCDSFIEIDLPKSQLTREAVFTDYTTANAAMADIYSKMRDTGLLTGSLYGIAIQMGTYSDEIDFYGSASNATVSFYDNALLPSNTTISLLWNNSYNQIYAANSVLEGTENSRFTSIQKAKLKGEALFVRSVLHFYLLQMFGEIPYIKTTDYKSNSAAKKMAAEHVYENITEDLKTAESLLQASYDTADRVRVNSYAVKSFLARVYLYRSMWKEASDKASEVISNSTLYTFENNLNKVFLKNSTEAIWQFMPSLTGKNTDEGSIFIFTSAPPPLVALNASLVNSFDSNDLRKSSWITKLNVAGGTWFYPSKYKESKPTASSTEYSMVLRLTEQFLIRAEAKLELSDFQGAREDLNRIRQRAGIEVTTAGSKEELIQAVLDERRKEMFTEYGHRFFDLKRRGRLDSALGSKPGWNSNDALLPIPESELNVNPNLKPQNPGY